MSRAALLAVALVAVPLAAATARKPIIGVLSVPRLPTWGCDTMSRSSSNATAARGGKDGAGAASSPSCFTGFYAKWIEQGGARAVVIPYDAPPDDMDTLVDSVNGVLFTGGNVKLRFNETTGYMAAAGRIFDRMNARHAAGIWQPLWGTCMGFQTLNILAARNDSALSRAAFDSENLALPLALTAYGKRSRMLGADTPQDVLTTLTSLNVTENLHHDGVKPSQYATNANLSSFFKVVSTNVDRKGVAFVSTSEHPTRPVYAVQWHPERNQFEWDSDLPSINHGGDAVRAMSWLSSFFIAEARKNNATFAPNASHLLEQYSLFAYLDSVSVEGKLSEGHVVYHF